MSEKTDLENTLLLAIPEEKQPKRGWGLFVNGHLVQSPITSVQLVNGRFGTFTYGLDPAGYDRWGFREIGGGGSVIVPYAVAAGNQVLVGVVLQNRPGQGGKVWNVPRGFLAPEESHFEAAKREAGEEFDGAERGQVIELRGEPTNPNSTFFETCFEHQGRPAGVRLFASRFGYKDLEYAAELNGWRVRPGLYTAADPKNKLAEQILGSRFIPWTEAVQLGDLFTVAAVGRLMGSIAT